MWNDACKIRSSDSGFQGKVCSKKQIYWLRLKSARKEAKNFFLKVKNGMKTIEINMRFAVAFSNSFKTLKLFLQTWLL